ncbi:ATP-binding protein [Halomonas sp. hl-4]|uniref:ATP-binding protein n=1 Tax=Halomonas sp. hl-4 TaxID=1761789 RepID=UPI000BB859EA|nr:ATP-binding protein [Halomonas sp. hl-4]SNY97064.1 two-component system, OmpR family, sensor histidine kinase AdeS [Halomonas sp. hl-4]
MKLIGLSRTIALTMAAMAFGITLLVVVTSYVFYFITFHFWQGSINEPNMFPSGLEWAWLVSTTLVGLAFAVIVGMHLARRILVPLNSVTESMRRVAQGNLDVRATTGDRSLGEAAVLANDFNALADQLQRMSKEMTFWNAAIAHELRTPVTILRGRLQGLAEGVFPPEKPQFQSLLTQIDGMAQLIEDLRAVSLAESGHLNLEVKQCDLSTEIESVVEFCRHTLSASNHYPTLDLQSGAVYCDPFRIRQALLALLENARQHASPGSLIIQTRQDDGWCVLRVMDSGPGIPQEYATQIFTAFRHARDAGSGMPRDKQGSGLGLAVVAAIARAHHGEAKCYPSDEGGSCFELRWPTPSHRA